MHWICKWCLKTMLRKETSLRLDINFLLVCGILSAIIFLFYVHLLVSCISSEYIFPNTLCIAQAFQVLSEYLQILDSLSELSSIQEMSRGVEVKLSPTKIAEAKNYLCFPFPIFSMSRQGYMKQSLRCPLTTI